MQKHIVKQTYVTVENITRFTDQMAERNLRCKITGMADTKAKIFKVDVFKYIPGEAKP